MSSAASCAARAATPISEKSRVKSYRIRAASYITKPVNFEGFRQLVTRFALYWTIVSHVPPTY